MGQHHDRALVEDDAQFKTEVANNVVATMECPTLRCCTPRRCTSSKNAGAGAGASRVISLVAGLYKTAPFSATTNSHRLIWGKISRSSGNTRPVTKINFRPEATRRSMAPMVSALTLPSEANVPS
jgi:hypothetical protein